MKSGIWCVCLCAIAMLVASPAALAEVHRVPSGGGWDYGQGYGGYDESGGTSCSATASASGSCTSSGANYYASVNVYTDQAGWFYVNWDSTAYGSAEYIDQTGSGASGDGAGGASTYGGGASAGMSLSNGGTVSTDSDDDYDPGSAGMTEEALWFDAFGSVGASCDCGAFASVGGSPNSASAGGGAYADVGL
jgi:hypothetical protein